MTSLRHLEHAADTLREQFSACSSRLTNHIRGIAAAEAQRANLLQSVARPELRELTLARLSAAMLDSAAGAEWELQTMSGLLFSLKELRNRAVMQSEALAAELDALHSACLSEVADKEATLSLWSGGELSSDQLLQRCTDPGAVQISQMSVMDDLLASLGALDTGQGVEMEP